MYCPAVAVGGDTERLVGRASSERTHLRGVLSPLTCADFVRRWKISWGIRASSVDKTQDPKSKLERLRACRGSPYDVNSCHVSPDSDKTAIIQLSLLDMPGESAWRVSAWASKIFAYVSANQMMLPTVSPECRLIVRTTARRFMWYIQ